MTAGSDVSASAGTRAARVGTIPNVGRILFGGDYNPEQWPEETWVEDARLMQEAGVNLVSLGIFAWAKIEPALDQFDLEWLDRVIDLLHARGISVNLATPTASPPPWLINRHPEILPVTAEGVTLWHGSRRHYCPSSSVYRERATRLVRALAEHYRDHPAIVLWHVDNEYACHVTECFCDASAAAFRTWLRQRHGTLSALNEAWGTAFWGQIYGDWQEVHPPKAAPSFLNPGQLLDWRRFTSDAWLACFRDQKEILRAITPAIPITTNFMNFHEPLDYWTWAAEEDVVSNDSYPDTSDPEWMVDAAMGCDLMRSLGNGRAWLLMEQASSYVNWRHRNAAKRPGVMRLGSFQAIARGANAVMFFQWRASRDGAEKYHSAMLPHGGTETRAWREVSALGRELAGLDEISPSTVKAEVAIAFDWENLWAYELGAKPSNGIPILTQIRALYGSLFSRNVTVDFVHPRADLSRYRLVLAPHLYLVDDESVANLSRWVAAGGTLLMTFFSGIVDPLDRVRPGPYPGAFRDLLGLTIEEFVPQVDGQTNAVETSDGRRFETTLWSDVIEVTEADVLARFAGDFFAGSPAVTVHRVDKGSAYYVGTNLDPSGLAWLLDLTCRAAGVSSAGGTTQEGGALELVERWDGPDRWLFALNHGASPVQFALDRPAVDAISGARVDGSVRVEPSNLVILRSTHGRYALVPSAARAGGPPG